MVQKSSNGKDGRNNRLGKMLRALRKKCGLNQGELADRAGINRSYLSNLENGHSNPTIDVLEKLAQGLGIGMNDLFPDGIITGSLLSGDIEAGATDRSPLLKEEKHFTYDADNEFDIYPGLREFLNDEDEIMLAQPTKEEIELLRSIRFGRRFRPDKRFYRETLLSYRRSKISGSSSR